MKVLYITNIPSPYKVDYYNELGKYCELTALFEAETSTERSEEWKKYRFETFDGIILKGKRVSVDTAFCPEIVKYLQKGRYDIVVLTVLASPTALLAVHTLRRRKIPYYYEGDGGFAKEASGIKATLKRYLISAAGKCFSSSKASLPLPAVSVSSSLLCITFSSNLQIEMSSSTISTLSAMFLFLFLCDFVELS